MMKILCLFLCFTYARSFHITADEGSKKLKIIGGSRTNILEVPYQASFEYKEEHTCGATIISDVWIISAAHCFKYTPDVVAHGRIRVGASFKKRSDASFQIKRLIIHPNYNPKTNNNDIALIELASAITFNEKQKPIPIVKSYEFPQEGQLMTISGYGRTKANVAHSSFLKKADVKVIGELSCQEAYKKYDPITENMFCAQSQPNDACIGDSGGPAVINGKLAGIISTGYSCGTGTYPGVYTKVYKYYNWIVKSTHLQL